MAWSKPKARTSRFGRRNKAAKEKIMPYELSWIEASVRSTKDLTPTVRLFEIVPADGRVRDYTPGSHIAVSVPLGGRLENRHYSLTGLRADGCYRIAVKRQPESRGGSAYMWSLAPGARLTVSEPQTQFEIDWNRPAYRLVAGGIGITPIYGMALRLAQRGADVRLAYAVRQREDATFAAELAEALGERLEIHASAEGRRLDVGAFLSGHKEGTLAAVCGPLSLMNEARRAWAASGGAASDLRFETFGSSGGRPSEPFRVRFSRHGETREIAVPETKSMLDALAEAGVEVAYDCLRGECGLCVLDVTGVSGEIDHRDVFLSDRQKQANKKFCACVSRATGCITIDSAYRAG
jgi:ferredoxin-NADP reductase